MWLESGAHGCCESVLMRPGRVGEREQAPGKTRMVFLEVLSARSDGGDASERASEKSKLGAAPILRSAFSSALHSSHVRRTANCSFSGSSRKTARECDEMARKA